MRCVVTAVMAVMAVPAVSGAQTPPPEAVPPEVAAPSTPSQAAQPEAAPEPEEAAVVRGAVRRGRGATAYTLPTAPYRDVPRGNAGELLTLAPGVMLSNVGTEGHAQHIFLRGFTGDNGQDLAVSVEGIPLNEESNVHGQGYVDLYFILPELVQRLEVTQGVADPRQGNFAVAGSVDYRLGLPQRGAMLRASLGMFGYRRLVALWGPARASEHSFAGVESVHSDGFGPARGYDRTSVLAQHRVSLGAGTDLTVLVGGYAARYTMPGLVREDDYAAGRVGFFDTVPGLGRQGGRSARALVSTAITHRRGADVAELRLWGQLRDFGLDENFTGFVLRPREGDLIAQRYSAGTLGATGSYAHEVTAWGRRHGLELGFFLRHDRTTLGQNRLDALTGDPAATRDASDLDTGVRVTHLGLYGDLTARPFAWLTLHAGGRLDTLAYDIDATVYRSVDMRTLTVHRAAVGTHLAPKATAEVLLGRGVSVALSHGAGFRSPEATTLADGETAPFVRVQSQEAALRYRRSFRDGRVRVESSLAGYHTSVDRDLLFDPVAGRSVVVGETRRLGAVLWGRLQALRGLDVNASLTFTRATVLEDALGRTVPAGSLLPYVPQWVGRADASYTRPLGHLRGQRVTGRVSLGAQYYGPRPLPLDARSEPVFVVDAGMSARVGPVELGLAARNLLDARWRDAQLNFASNFVPNTVPSLFPTRHFNAGMPLTVMATLTVYLGGEG
jgi:iron complex outermembrane receptor protein